MKNLRDELKNRKNISDFIHIDDVLGLLDQWEKEQDVNIRTVEAYRSGRESVLRERDCEHVETEHKNLRCICCAECGEILDVQD